MTSCSAFYGVGISTTFKQLIEIVKQKPANALAGHTSMASTINLFNLLHRDECFIARNRNENRIIPDCLFQQFLETLGIKHEHLQPYESYLDERQVKYLKIIDILLEKFENYLSDLKLLDEPIMFAHKTISVVEDDSIAKGKAQTTSVIINPHDLSHYKHAAE